MIESFTVLSSNIVVLDHSVYQLWLLGRTVDQAVAYRTQHLTLQPSRKSVASAESSITNVTDSSLSAQAKPQQPKPPSDPAVSPAVLRNYILTQYRTFELLEHYLHHPPYLTDQFLLPMSKDMKAWLVERYYHFDQSVVRELLGKKLNSRARKDLEEICEKTKVPLGSCKRQFDNLKRIMKRAEDVEGRSIAQDIEEKFMLTKEQASQYAHIIFINNNRLDTSHKKLRTYSFLDFEFCASVLQKHWTSPLVASMEEFDSNLGQDIRELKPLLLNSRDVIEDLRNMVVAHFTAAVSSTQATSGIGGPPLSSSCSSMASFGTNVDGSSALPPLSSPSSAAGALPSATTGSPMMTPPPSGSLERAHRTIDKLSSFFKPLLRSILSLGAGVGNAKETRDIFVAILEKVVEPCLSVSLGPREFEAVMDALASRFSDALVSSETLRASAGASYPHVCRRLCGSFVRLIHGLRGAGTRLMKRHPSFIKRSSSTSSVNVGGKVVSDVI